MLFRDRTDAGRQLAERIVELDLPDPVLLALPRGGVPVAVEIGTRLDIPVEVFVVRKIGVPGHEELGIGAVAEGSDALVVTDVARQVGVNEEQMRALAERERGEV